MDIVVSSNFERLLFEAYDRNSDAVTALLERFAQESVAIAEAPLERLRRLFTSFSVGDEQILEATREAFAHTGELLDPHTATGYRAARSVQRRIDVPMITLATAHPAKFEHAVMRAGFERVPLPESMHDLMDRQERYDALPAELAAVQRYVARHRH